MIIDPVTSLINPVIFKPSPFCDERSKDSPIDMIVLHGISLPPNVFGNNYVEDFFCGKLDVAKHPFFETIASLKVSAHLFINRKGLITQFVPFAKRAWHAGESFFQGRTSCNDFSIGIELEGADHIPYEDLQYQQLSQIIPLLQKTYPLITRDRIVGHSDIAPGRKTDPGPAFNWRQLDGLL